MIVAFDLETAPIEPGLFFPRIAAAVFSSGKSDTTIVLRHEIAARIRPILESGYLIGVNLGFDLGCLMVHIPELIEPLLKALTEFRVISIDVVQKLMDVGRGELNQHGEYSAENIARRWGFSMTEKNSGWRVLFDGLRDIDPELWPEEARRYLLDDGWIPYEVFAKQLQSNGRNLHRMGMETFYDVALYATAAEGFPVHADRLKLAEERVSKHREHLLGILQEAGLVRSDGTKDKKACQALVEQEFKGGKVPRTKPSKLHPQGQICTDQDTIARCKHATLRAYSEYTTAAGSARARIDKLKEGLASPRGRVHTRYNCLADTGRTTSQETKTHPSVQDQNWHRGPVVWGGKETNLRLRECMRAAKPAPWSIDPVGWDTTTDDDWILLAADFTAAEMYALAQSLMDRFKFTKLGELLLAKVDPHAWYGGLAFEGGMTEKEVMASPRKKKIRGKAKPCNFGFPGGMGAGQFVNFARIQYQQEFTEPEAVHARDMWFQAFPEMREHLNWVSRLLRGGRFVDITTTRGGLVMGDRGFCNAANAMFQPPTAMGAKASHSALWVDSLTKSNILRGNFRVNKFVHDETVGFVRRSAVAEVAPYIRQRMRTIFTELVCPDYPIDVEISFGTAWNKTANDIKWQNKDGSPADILAQEYVYEKETP